MIISEPTEVGTLFRALRKKHDLKLREVSKGTGISITFLSDLERGKMPSLTTVMKLATFYGFKLELRFIKPEYSKTGQSNSTTYNIQGG